MSGQSNFCTSSDSYIALCGGSDYWLSRLTTSCKELTYAMTTYIKKSGGSVSIEIQMNFAILTFWMWLTAMFHQDWVDWEMSMSSWGITHGPRIAGLSLVRIIDYKHNEGYHCINWVTIVKRSCLVTTQRSAHNHVIWAKIALFLRFRPMPRHRT